MSRKRQSSSGLFENNRNKHHEKMTKQTYTGFRVPVKSSSSSDYKFLNSIQPAGPQIPSMVYSNGTPCYGFITNSPSEVTANSLSSSTHSNMDCKQNELCAMEY